MATAGSSKRPVCPPCSTASRDPSKRGVGLVPSPPECGEQFSAGVEGQSDCRHPPRPPAHPPSMTQRHICFHRKSDPEKSSTQPGKKDCDSRRGQYDYWRKQTSWSAVFDYICVETWTLFQVIVRHMALFHRPGSVWPANSLKFR